MSTSETSLIQANPQMVLICGESGSGKSASLRNIRNQSKWIYNNCEAGKRLPFPNKFKERIITDPYQVHEIMRVCAQNQDKMEGAIVDTLTFLLDMFESKYIHGAADGRAAWGNFQIFFKDLMQDIVPQIRKPILFLAHTRDIYNEKKLETKTSVPVKGALANTGIEAYFSTVVGTKRVSLEDLEPYANDMLTITEDDEILGFKYVFQTRLTKETRDERIRSPLGLFSREQTYIDNDAQLLVDHLTKYYGA